MKPTDAVTNRLAIDPAAGADLRARLRDDPQAGLKQTAQQFEGLLLHLMLKSMRDATPTDGLLGSEQSRFFTTLGDQQLAQNLAAQAPLGFAGMIEKQLASQMTTHTGAAVSSPLDALQQSLLAQQAASAAARAAGPARRTPVTPAVTQAGTTAEVGTSAASSPPGARAFVDRVWPHAVEAAALTGVPAHFLVAHSALESGWGKHEITMANGSPSFNIFGIKAGRNWSGPTAEVQTTEFVNGVAQSTRATFRAYGSYGEAFRDYAMLLQSKPRFSEVLGQQDGTQFARSLQQAGYATDPMYADKLARIISSSTLRQAIAAAGPNQRTAT
ncbi:Flagellar rod assembly protein/muramidase FlgJ [Candidatus Accumulibacter aalborgensis]|uniref:Peptidoglycan hydrolase FlgJ n=1 Tax=Candidatus Accumulibacter aalborgensis TaxID=1860102 RepID=A0A1A8XIS6_9PROT|nr:flagellar assembly peptidoglycan hydrolase FlgJ [Candidatus Accumulibacter aalborgensis]SBT05045.1 Flagellar rod assembly protein/muramidase FlgJ [Candidatus Accumulibacter aalborgensis]